MTIPSCIHIISMMQAMRTSRRGSAELWQIENASPQGLDKRIRALILSEEPALEAAFAILSRAVATILLALLIPTGNLEKKSGAPVPSIGSHRFSKRLCAMVLGYSTFKRDFARCIDLTAMEPSSRAFVVLGYIGRWDAAPARTSKQ